MFPRLQCFGFLFDLVDRKYFVIDESCSACSSYSSQGLSMLQRYHYEMEGKLDRLGLLQADIRAVLVYSCHTTPDLSQQRSCGTVCDML